MASKDLDVSKLTGPDLYAILEAAREAKDKERRLPDLSEEDADTITNEIVCQCLAKAQKGVGNAVIQHIHGESLYDRKLPANLELRLVQRGIDVNYCDQGYTVCSPLPFIRTE